MNELLEEFLEYYRHDGKFALTSEQKDFIRDSVDGDTHTCCFSPAGVGKSVVIEALKNYLKDKLVICATTGIANAILFNNKGGDGTMHRVFSLPLGMHKSTDITKVKKYCTGLFAGSDLVEYVLVEEAGMMNPDQLELIRLRIQRFNKPIKGKRKARNIKLILMGDYIQLLPVLSTQDKSFLQQKYGSHLLFESSPYKKLNFKQYEFTKVLRTDNKVMKACLDVLRYGQEDRYENCLKWLNQFQTWDLPEGLPFITTTNAKVDAANKQAVEANTNTAFVYRAKVKGQFNMKECPVEEVLTLKKGLPVITLVNQEDGEYSNGSFGYIEECFDDGVMVSFPATNETHFVAMFEFEQRESFLDKETLEDGTVKDILNNKVVGTAMCCPVKVAAAFSVHRVQGRSIDVPTVVDLGYYGFDIDEDNDWGINMAYVALSRFRNPDNIILKYPLIHNTLTGKTHIKAHRKAIEYLRGEDKC